MAQRITPERAILLAQHATIVQGGYSTPEIEKARAEKDIAGGGKIDFDKIRNEVMAAYADRTAKEETEAALDEGLAPMSDEVKALRMEKLAIDEQMDALRDRLTSIKSAVDEHMHNDGVVGYTLGGKVKARKSHGTRTSVDGKRLKEELPAVWSNYLKTTEYVSITIT